MNYLRIGRFVFLFVILVLAVGACDSLVFPERSPEPVQDWTLGVYGPDAVPTEDRLLQAGASVDAEGPDGSLGILVLDSAGLWEISVEPGAHAPRSLSPASAELAALLDPETASNGGDSTPVSVAINHADPSLLRAFMAELNLRAAGGPVALQLTGSGSGYRQDSVGAAVSSDHGQREQSIIRSSGGEGLRVEAVGAALQGSGLALLVLDAPRTAAIEIGLELSATAELILAAPDDPGVEAWDARALLGALSQGLEPQETELGSADPPPVAIVADALEAVHAAFDVLCREAVRHLSTEPDQVAAIRDALFAGAVPDAWTTPGDLSLDLGSLVSYLGEAVPTLRDEVHAVQDALNRALLPAPWSETDRVQFGVHFVPLSALGAPVRHRDEYFADAADMMPCRFVRESAWAPRHGGSQRGLLNVLWYAD